MRPQKRGGSEIVQISIGIAEQGDMRINREGRKVRKHLLKNRQGVTLVELIVAFALLCLFLTALSQVIFSCMKFYYQIKGVTYGCQVSDTLLEKITGEIGGAQVSIAQGGASQDKTLKIYESGQVIELYDRTGSHICITTTGAKGKIRDDSGDNLSGNQYQDTEDQLLLYYYAVQSSAPGSALGTVTRYEAVDWSFDQAAYMGYYIEELKFSQADPSGAEYPPNIIRVDLTINHDRYGSYKAVSYIECYNFSEPSDYDKIQEEA